MVDYDAITGVIIDTALAVHRRLGPGLLESVYALVLEFQLKKRGLDVVRNMRVSVNVDGLRVDNAFRIDLLVERCVVVELKSVDRLHAVHWKQLLTYLRLLDLPVGLLLNFGAPTMKEGIRRVVNNYRPRDDDES